MLRDVKGLRNQSQRALYDQKFIKKIKCAVPRRGLETGSPSYKVDVIRVHYRRTKNL